MSLTEEQQAVVYSDEGNSVVLAGPGSGKTHTLTEKIFHLFNDNVIPEPFGLLAITFTHAAANEMRSRLNSKGFRQWDRVFIGTFHSFGNYLLSCYSSDIGIREDFDVINSEAQAQLIDEILQNYPGNSTPNIVHTIESLKKQGIYPGRGDGNIQSQLRNIFNEYENELRSRNLVDFDDLISLTIRLWSESAHVQRVFSNFYRHILVDEFQDTDGQQLEMVKLLTSNATGVTIVADDDQSIYGWRGANRHNVEIIIRELNANLLQLGVNFRSDQVIVEAANQVIQRDVDRQVKNIRPSSNQRGHIYYNHFDSEEEESLAIGNRILQLSDSKVIEDLGEISVITRVRWRANNLLDQLDVMNVNWFDRSQLQFADTWDALLGLAILNLGLNISSSDRLYNVMSVVDNSGLTFQSAEQDALEVAIKIRNDLQEKIDYEINFENMHAVLSAANYWKIVEAASWSSTEYRNHIKNINKMVHDLTNLCTNSGISLSDAINRLSGLGAVQIMTGQGAKGKEFKYVFFMGLENDVIPDRRARTEETIAEERRIFYVGLTRARNAVYLSSVARRVAPWGDVNTHPSCFLENIPRELFEPFI